MFNDYLGEIDISLFADQIGEAATNTTDGGHGEHDVAGTFF